MNHSDKWIRRAARCALENALKRSGMPPDLTVLPHPDDATALRVVNLHAVQWMWGYRSGERASIAFGEDYTSGRVVGTCVFDLVETPGNFDPADFGIEPVPGYAFSLDFEISDQVELQGDDWEDLSEKPPTYREQAHRTFKAKRALQ